MARSRKQALSPASYPAARLVQWCRDRWNVLRRYKHHIVIFGGTLAACGVAGASWLVWKGYLHDQGLAHFRAGLMAIDGEEYGLAIQVLLQAEAALDGESQALALLYLGEAYEKADEAINAKASYERVASADGADSYLKQLALLRLAHGAEQAKDLESAARWYREASALDGPSTGEALLALGETLELQGGQDPSRPYLDLLERFPDTTLADLIRAKTE